MSAIHITDLEAAINYWRQKQPSPDGFSLAKPTRALAEVYARMVWARLEEVDPVGLPDVAMQAWADWYASTPDTPCIAICSTSQGDDVCKGCGRTFAEVQYWTEMNALQKRATWRRITQDGSAWRFNKYAERAVEARQV
jgi:predicted Fe-S protein YdhL (DUF1289 family)